MLSFDLSAIDIILVISVIVLLTLYWTKLSKITEEQPLTRSTDEHEPSEKVATNIQSSYAECPRGFGNIKRMSTDDSVSERCLGCYRIMDCYGESEEFENQINQF